MNFLETGIGGNMLPEEEAKDVTIQALQDADSPEQAQEQALEYNPLVSFVKEVFYNNKTKRSTDEDRWLTAYRNYRGIYGPDTQFLDTEKSQAFIKLTKTKVLAAYSQLTEVLFSSQKFPIGVIPAEEDSDNTVSKVTVKGGPTGPMGASQAPTGAPSSEGGDPASRPMSKAVSRPDILDKIGAFKDVLEPAKDKLKTGGPSSPEDITFEPAKVAGRKMEGKIQDQLNENGTARELRSVAFEMCLFGHGVLKGPLGTKKEYPRWNQDGMYDPAFEFIPDNQHVSIWDFYPDSNSRSLDDCENVVQRHCLSKTSLRGLKNRPSFLSEAIEAAITGGFNYVPEYWEFTLDEREQNNRLDRYEVLEYWGYVDKAFAEEYELTIPKEYEDLDQVQVNIWICNDQIIRFVMNPFKPQRIPYHSVPYELNPYSFFGVGVAENMEDTQEVMNGFFRLMIDNAVLSSNVIFEVDETNLVPNQDMTMRPGKIFRRQGGAPGQAIFGTKIPNVTQEVMMVFDKARQLADEATGMPSYAHGQTGVQGVGRTASGMNMLMGAAAQNIKAVVRNIDDYLLAPLGQDMFAFNMQYNFDPDFLGNVKVVARGTESLMRNEIRSQKIMQFLQLTANQIDAPIANREYLYRELAAGLDLDPEMAVNDSRQAKLAALLMKDMAQAMGGMPNSQMGGAPNPAGVPAPDGAETGGTQPGLPQVPGEQGFSANSNPQAGGVSGQNSSRSLKAISG